MRSFKTFLAEQDEFGKRTNKPSPILQGPGQMPATLGGGSTGGGKVGQKPLKTLTRQPFLAANRFTRNKFGRDVPFRALAGALVGSTGVIKSANVYKKEVNKYLRSQGFDAGPYTPEFDMPQPEFDTDRQVSVPDYNEPRKAFGRTVPGINKAKEGPDTLGKFELLYKSQKALGSTPGDKAKNLGRILTTKQGLDYAGPAVMDAAAMAVNPLIPATTGTLAPDTSFELRKRGTRAATRAYEALTGKKPAELYSPTPTDADTQATENFEKLRQSWIKAARKKESNRLKTSKTPASTPSTLPTDSSGDIDLDDLF